MDTEQPKESAQTQQAGKNSNGLYRRVSDLKNVLYTDNFSVTDFCVSCGYCERVCPAEAIQLDSEGVPTWTKHKCFMCFGCLRLCPTQSIRYGGA